MNDIPYVDIHRVFDGSEPILLGFDGVHPLPEGHRLIATVVSDTPRSPAIDGPSRFGGTATAASWHGSCPSVSMMLRPSEGMHSTR